MRPRRGTHVLPMAAVALVLVVVGACGEDEQEAGAGAGAVGGGGESGKIALLLPESKTARYETQDRPHFARRIEELCQDCEISLLE